MAVKDIKFNDSAISIIIEAEFLDLKVQFSASTSWTFFNFVHEMFQRVQYGILVVNLRLNLNVCFYCKITW